MANGFKFAGEISLSAPEIIYTPGANVAGVVTVNICNASQVLTTPVSIGYSASATTAAQVWIERGVMLAPSEVLERTGLVLTGTQTLIAQCGTTSECWVTAFAVEDTA